MTRIAINARSTKLALVAGTAVLALAATAARAAPIDTNQPNYLQSQVGSTVSPTFAGGTLRDDQNAVTDAHAYSVGNFATNTIDAYANTVTFSGGFSGAGPLTLVDSIGGGTVVVTANSGISGALTIGKGATLQWGNGSGIASIIGSSIVDNGALVVNVGGNNGIGLGGPAITGSGSFVVQSGRFRNFTASTYTGTTTINTRAILYLGTGGSIAASSGVTANGTFDISGLTNGGTSVVSLGGGGAVALGGNTLTMTGASDTFSGVIGGSGGLTIAGGTETFTGINSYIGTTTIGSGAKLVLSGPNSGSITASAGVADYGVFDLSGTTSVIPIQSLAGNGSVLLGSQGLQLLNAADTFSGVISGAGALFVHAGRETLTGTNTYTNRTVIGSGAVLALAGSGSISTTRTVTDDSVFDISGLTNGGTSLVSLGGHGSVVLGVNTLTLTGAGDIFYGVISGSGGLTVAGGTETLSGLNTYTGMTTINSGAKLMLTGVNFDSIAASAGLADYGTLDVTGLGANAQIATLSGNGSVVEGPHGLQIMNAADTFAGVISGTSGLVLHAGTETLAGTNTYTGGTVINFGADLALTGSGSIANSASVQASGIFDISGTTSGASIKALSGPGSVLLGSKTLTLIGAFNAFSGVISGSGGLTIASGSQTLSGANTYTGLTTINGGSTLTLGSGGTGGSIVGNVLDNGSLSFNRSDTLTYGGVISGAGVLVQSGHGTTVLNGVNTLSGQTTVAAGVLEVGDAAHPGAVLDSHIGGVVVAAAGTLSGHGTITGAVTNTAGGVVAPGGSVGTLTVGTYTQGANSALAIEVSPAAASRLNVLGSASLNGTLALTFDDGYYSAPAIYQIVTGAPVSGTFSTVTQVGLPSNFVQGIYYKPGGGEVDLAVEPRSSAQGFATLSTATLDEAQSLAGMVSDRQDDAGCPTGSRVGAKAGGAACDGVAVWGQVLARRAHTDGLGEIADDNDTSGGFILGLDTRLSGGSVGLALAYSQNTLNMDGAAARSTGHSIFASAYGRLSTGGFELDAQAFYMDSAWTQSRVVGTYGVASSRPNGTTGGGVVQVAYPMMDGRVKPYAKVSYADFNRDAVTETTTQVGPLALAVASASNASARAELGVKFATSSTGANGVVMSPELRLGVSQDLSANGRDVQARLALAPTTTFVSSGVRPAQTAGVIAGALRVKLNDKLDLYGDLRGRFSQNQSEGSVNLGGRYRF